MKRRLHEHTVLRKLFTASFAVLVTVTAFAQRTHVTGHVVDGDGAPVAGALISERDNPASGVVSATDGSFAIEAAPTATLKVSMMGFETAEFALKGRGSVAITLRADLRAIDDVVVIGYGSMRRGDLTGAVASVGERVLADQPVNSFGAALQGRAAGVLVVDNGNPQENVSLKIRGIGTIGNSDPLYVIDGVPTSLGLNSINVADIETIDILKDASATAIYGSQGAGGVVIITTKKGAPGRGVLSFSANFGLSQPTRVPRFLDAAQYAALNNEIMASSGNKPNPDWADPQSLGKGTDWIDLMFGNAFRHDYNLSWSGGGERSTWYISGGFTDHDGIVRSVKYRRATFQINSTHRVKRWLRLGENITISTDTKKNGTFNLSDVFSSLPTQRVRDDEGKFDGPGGHTEWYGGIRNQYATSVLDKNKTQGYNLLGSVFAEFDIVKGLKFKSLASVEAKMAYTSNFTPKYDYKPTPVPETTYYKGTSRDFAYLWDNYFNYDRSFGDHRVSAMAGMSLQWGNNDWFNGSKSGFLKDEIHQLDNGKKIDALRGSTSEWSIASVMVRANYSYKDKYLITATVRRDGSSRFGPKHRWGTFPSVGVAWRISDEGWFDNHRFVTSLKLRAGYGVTGHQKIPEYGFFSAYRTAVYSFNGTVVPTLVPHMLPNPTMRWEEVHQTNVGLDSGMWHERLRVTLDLYNKDTRGMLVPYPVPVSSGYSDTDVPYINAGRVNNSGIEVGIAADLFSDGKFQWTSEANFSFNRGKIVSLNGGSPIHFNGVVMAGEISVHAEGHPINSFYGFVADGIFQNRQEVDEWAVQIAGATAPGDVRFRDLDNNGVINDNDRTFIGNPNPDCIFAWNNTFRYGGFDLGVFLQGVYGGEVFNANRIFQESLSGATNQYATVLHRWKGEGTSQRMPRAVEADGNKNARISTRFVEDGSYLRLKNLTMGYTLPPRIMRRAGIENFRIYVTCMNLATLTRYTGFDPEVGIDGVDRGLYPVTRSFSLGLDLKF